MANAKTATVSHILIRNVVGTPEVKQKQIVSPNLHNLALLLIENISERKVTRVERDVFATTICLA